MQLYRNSAVEWLPGSEEEQSWIEFILWISPDSLTAVVINLSDRNSFPIVKETGEIICALNNGSAKITKMDFEHNSLLLEEHIEEKHRTIRDSRWKVISELVQDEPHIYDPDYRANRVKEAVEKNDVSKMAVYKYLKLYWHNGACRNALLPAFRRCGAPDKERRALDRKRGRPRAVANLDSDFTGINVTGDIKNYLVTGLRMFYLKGGRVTLHQAYINTLAKFFNIGYKSENGVLQPILPHPGQLPSFDQFKYWHKKEFDTKLELEQKFGERVFNLLHRSSVNSSATEAIGPGSIYQIDATIGDVYLVSRFDRTRIIGRPVIYVLIDVFSRLVTGLYVGLEGPSWLGAMMALENAAQDKVEFCSRYGIDISPEQWPSRCVPEAIIADRGEMLSESPHNLINVLGVQVKNVPSYRADWKGIIEQHFRICNLSFIHWLPGAVYARERGDHDYRLDAKLDMQEFTELMIKCILYYNNERMMDWYPLEVDMIKDGVKPFPVELWRWGIQNRSGHLREYPTDIVRLNLMPAAYASVTRSGVLFNKMYYTGEAAIRGNWFIRDGTKRWKVPISYDPREVNYVYLRDSSGMGFEKFRLLEREGRYSGMRLEEVQDMLAVAKMEADKLNGRIIQAEVEKSAVIESTIMAAEAKTNEALKKKKLSKSKRTADIRENKRKEKETIRDEEKWVLGSDDLGDEVSERGEVREFPTEDNHDTGPKPVDKVEMLRKLREGR